MDLMEMVKGALNSQVRTQIGTALGADSQAAGRAIDAAIPAIFGGLVKQASTPAGVSNLSNALEKMDPATMDNLGAMLSGAKLQGLIELGTKWLPTVFGPNYSSLFATLGKVTGLGTGKIGPLLGMLVPIVLGSLAKAKKASGLDATGVARLVTDQKASLAGLDGGLAAQLGLTNLLGAATSMADTVRVPVPKSVDVVHEKAAKGVSSLSRLLIPLLGVLALALALYVFYFNKDRGDATAPRDSSTLKERDAAPPAKKSDESPSASMRTITGFLAEASKAFGEIKDEAGAKSAAEALQKLAARVDSLQLNTLAGPAKVAASTAIKKFLDEAKEWAEKAYSIPGVKDSLEPAVNSLIDKFKAFAG